ncbi:MAG: hypothetical protein RLZZ330_1063 [Actinomycetota bacterium]|jgi:hypothetical protein
MNGIEYYSNGITLYGIRVDGAHPFNRVWNELEHEWIPDKNMMVSGARAGVHIDIEPISEEEAIRLKPDAFKKPHGDF